MMKMGERRQIEGGAHEKMWFTRAISRWDRRRVAWTASAAAVSSAYCWAASTTAPDAAKFDRHIHYHHYYSQCDEGPLPLGSDNDGRFQKQRRATVNKANAARMVAVIKRANTREELSKLRSDQDEMLQRWERDEDGWRELPARAWPEYQPNPEQLKGIQKEVTKNNCSSSSSASSSSPSQYTSSDICQSLLFNVATAQVFYNVDPKRGFEQYEDLAQTGHVDSMVACGVILVEGFVADIRNREEEGVQWLKRAVSQGSSSQALYELGTVYYTGIDGVVQEDPEQAFGMFEKAAAKGHVGALYMMADCLIEGEGTKIDVARAIPLLYQAADQGHRYARQRVRELLKDKTYQN
jgi:hypothetical protein